MSRKIRKVRARKFEHKRFMSKLHKKIEMPIINLGYTLSSNEWTFTDSIRWTSVQSIVTTTTGSGTISDGYWRTFGSAWAPITTTSDG